MLGHNVDFNDDSFLKSRKPKDNPPLWDTFQDPPSRRATGSAASWAKLGCLLKLFKLFTYIFVFIVVLATAITSKLSFLLMVSQLRKNRDVKRCNALDRNFKFVIYRLRHSGGYGTIYIYVWFLQGQEELFTVVLPKEEQYTWIWALIFAFAAPEIFTFFRALRICTFKDVQSPTWIEFILVLSFDTLHTIGMAILVFFVMPQLNSVQALMLCNAVCFLPSLLKTQTVFSQCLTTTACAPDLGECLKEWFAIDLLKLRM